MSASIISGDNFFKSGIIALLGEDFIRDYYIIIDLDCLKNSGRDIPLSNGKEVVGFASSDFSYYLADKLKIKFVIKKNSALKDIVDFFLFKRNNAIYYPQVPLTHRERQLLDLVCAGADQDYIANRLGVKTKTAYTFRRNVMLKLGCGNRIKLQKMWLERNT